jgi:hypothetical protein
LLQGHGDGSFTDVTAQAKLLLPAALVTKEQEDVNLNNLRHHSSHSATWADYDLDGWLDLFIVAERDHWVGNQKCRLYHNNRDGTFTDVADPAMRECGWLGNPSSKGGSLSKGSTWGDVNNDGFPDLYISHLDGPNSLFLNKGRPKKMVKAEGLLVADGWDFEEVGRRPALILRLEHLQRGCLTTTTMALSIYLQLVTVRDIDMPLLSPPPSDSPFLAFHVASSSIVCIN